MITGFHRIVIFCNDTETSKQWYEKVGFAYKRGYDGMHWFGLGDGEIMLHPRDDELDGARPTIHVAVTALDDLLARVKRAGLQPLDHQRPNMTLDAPVRRPWGDREFEMQDPDGQWWAFTEVDAGGEDPAEG